MIYGHGSDIHQYSNIVADFSSNVWYKGIPQGLKEHLCSKIDTLIYYPEPDAGSLAEEIAQLHKLKKQNVLVCNGTTEAFYLLAQVFAQHQSYIPIPSFSEYEDACRVFGHAVFFLNNNVDFSAIQLPASSVFWLGNPNNPDGKIRKTQEIQALCEKHPDSYFVVDEAYGDLCHGFVSMIPFVGKIKNLIVVKSLTKTFAIPGLRLGYVLASADIIQKLLQIKIPWTVNSLAIEAGHFIVQHYADFLPDTVSLLQESLDFQQQLAAIAGVEVQASVCNFFLAKLQHHTALQLKQRLMLQHGLLIRDAANFKGLSPQHFRVSIQKEEHNCLFIQHIKNTISVQEDEWCK